MNLLQIGPTVVNLDRVTLIRDCSARDTQGNVVRPLFRIEFETGPSIDIASQAEPLRAWLAAHAISLSP
jgi:hypothetical protein